MNVESVRQKTWDFGLTIITVALLGSLGIQSFIGTAYVWWAQAVIPGWDQFGYPGFVFTMNAIAAPQVVALVVVMGLCVPKRLFSRRLLLVVSAAMVAAGIVAAFAMGSIVQGMAVYLALAALIQVAVVVLTAAGAKGPSYLTEGRLTKLGSGLLHLGFIVFAFIIAVLQRSQALIPTFWVATVLAIGGTLLGFYADRLAWRRFRRTDEQVERSF